LSSDGGEDDGGVAADSGSGSGGSIIGGGGSSGSSGILANFISNTSCQQTRGTEVIAKTNMKQNKISLSKAVFNYLSSSL